MFYTVKLTNSLFSPSVFFLLYAWKKNIQKHLIFGLYQLKKYRSTLTEWIMYSNVRYWYLSENDSASNLFERTQVYLQSYTQLFSTNEIKKVNLNECNRRKTSCICISSSLHVRRTHMHSLMMPNTLWHSNYVAVSFGVGSEPKFHRQKI